MKYISSPKKPLHFPVMLKEVLKISQADKGGLFVDCTFGSGGYSNAILSFPKTKVIALDRDLNTKIYADKTKKINKNRFTFFNIKFSEINKIINKNTKADCIIFDLGLSSLQISNLKRGFSFNSKGKIDMRMGLNSINAQDVLNNLDIKTLSDIFKFFGDERDAYNIARNIVKLRKNNPINSVPDFVKIIEKKINISTQAFQAIRIFVNKEITELIEGLINASKLLKEGGIIIVVTFHSIEDKIVKFFFRNFSSNQSRGSRYYPDKNKTRILFENYKNIILRPEANEIKINNRSRSAKLRFAVRSKDEFFNPKDLKNKFSHLMELENIYAK